MKQNKKIITALLLTIITSTKMYASEEEIILLEDQQHPAEDSHKNNAEMNNGQPPMDYIKQQNQMKFDQSSQESRSDSLATNSMSRSSSTNSMNQSSDMNGDNSSLQLQTDNSSLNQVGLQKSFNSRAQSAKTLQIINDNPTINDQETAVLKNPQYTMTSADGQMTTYTSNKISITINNKTGKIVKSNAPKTNLPHNSKSMFAANRMTTSNITKTNGNMTGSEKLAVSNGKRTINADNGTTTYSYNNVNFVIDTNTLRVITSNAPESAYSKMSDSLPSYAQATSNEALPAYEAPSAHQVTTTNTYTNSVKNNIYRYN